MRIRNSLVVWPRFVVTLLAFLLVTVVSAVDFPPWWTSRGILKVDGAGVPLAPNDFAVLNQGQLKNIALAAFHEFEQRIPGGAGPDVTLVIDGFTRIENGQRVPKTGAPTNDFAVVSVGQLKAMATPFYTRFAEVYLEGVFPWPIRQGIIDDYAVATIGQAKALFAFDLSSPIAIPAPNPVQVTTINATTFRFQWTSVPSATSYRIERKQPYIFGPGYHWITLATVPAPATSYDDHIPATNEIYAYRAIAIASTPPRESRPSAEAVTQTGADTDGDRVPDFAEGGDENDADGDGIADYRESDADDDGIPDAMEFANGTDPRDTDTDDDGLSDEEDFWPSDPIRIKPIPRATYAAIDLNDYLLERVSPTFTGPVIDSSGKVAWAGLAFDDFNRPIKRTVAWDGGTVTTQDAVPAYWDFDIEGVPHRAELSLEAGGLSNIAANGTINGNGRIIYEFFDDSIPGWYPLDAPKITFTLTSSGFDTSPDYSWPPPSDNRNTNLLTSVNGALSHVEYSQAENQERRTLKVNGTVVYGPVNVSDTQFEANAYAISPGGHLIWVRTLDGEAVNIYSRPLGTGYDHIELDWSFPIGNCNALNDEGWTVGTQMYFTPERHNYEDPDQPRDPANPNGPKGRGELGFLWVPPEPEDEEGVLITFHDLLPAEYQQMVRSAVPFSITENDAVTGYPSIAFTAQIDNGHAKGNWVWENLIMDWVDPDGAGPAQPEVRIRIVSLLNSTGHNATSQIRSINSSQLAVGSTIDAEVALFIPFEFVSLDVTGKPAEEPNGLRTSMPSPVVEVECSIVNVARDALGQIHGRVIVNGKVTSDLCDTMPGTGGQIDQIQLYVNDSEDPVAFIPVAVTKGDNGSFAKPYPYLGQVSFVVDNVPLTEGVNILRFAAHDEVYKNPGFCEWSAEIKATTHDSDADVGVASVSAGAALSSVLTDPQGRQQLTVSYARNSAAPQSITLTETAVGSGELIGTNGAGVTISAQTVSTGPPSKRRRFEVTVTDAARDLADVLLVLSESGFNTGQFNGAYTYLADSDGNAIEPPPPPEGETGSEKIILERVSNLDQSTGGTFHGVVARSRGGANWGNDFKVKIGTTGFESTMQTFAGTNFMFLSRPGTPHPFIFTLRAGKVNPDAFDESAVLNTLKEILLDKTLSSAARFLKGFGTGLCVGGYELIAGTVSFATGGLTYVGNKLLLFDCTVRVGIKTVFNVNSDAEYWMVTQLVDHSRAVDESVTALGDFVWEMSKFWQQGKEAQFDLIVALLTGDDLKRKRSLAGLSDMHQKMFSFGAEVIQMMWESFTANKDLDDPEVQGYLMGRVIFEIASLFVAPELVGLKLAQLTKLAFVEKLLTRPFFQSGGGGHRILQKGIAFRNKLATTKMCFVAGTPVWTKEGLKNIENIKAGDYVMSRDEFSGEQCYKPVLETFVTRPTTLVHVRYSALSRHGGESDGDDDDLSATAGETLVCTPQHPFYVTNRERLGFVEAGQLWEGDQLSLRDGSLVEINSLTTGKVAPGKLLTTYNFEVADFHTYFVGNSGVWVHNSSKAACEKAYSIFRGYRERSNGEVWGPFKETILRLRQVDCPEILNQKVFNEARKTFFDEGGSEIPPWLNPDGIVQNLKYAEDGVTPLADSGRLAANLEKVLGYKKIPSSEAHHIVSKAEPGAAELRAMLRRYGIHPDDASNGTFMVSKRTRVEFGNDAHWLDGLGPNHQNHPTQSAYLNKLNEDLDRFKALPATSANVTALKNELQRIAMKLVDNQYPWP